MKILTNFYFDLIEPKSFIGGTKSQQAAFRDFVEKKTKHELFGIFKEEHGNPGDEFKRIEAGNNFFGLSVPKFYFRDAFNGQGIESATAGFPKFFSFLRDVFEKVGPDCVFLNGFPWLSCLIGSFALKSGVPIVYVHAGLPFKEFNLYRDYLGDKQADFLLEKDKEISLSQKTVNIFLNDFSKKAQESEFLGSKCANSRVIPLAASFDFKCPLKKRRSEEGEIKVGLIGRWDRIKNHQAYFSLAKHASDENLPVKFLAITRIPDKTKLLGISKEEYARYIDVREEMPREDLWKFYQEVDVMACPSLFDVSPHIVFESLLCGTPVLISPGVGHNDLYEKFGLKNWILDFSNIPNAIKAIRKAAFENVSEKMIAHIKEEYSPSAVFGKYIEAANSAVLLKN